MSLRTIALDERLELHPVDELADRQVVPQAEVEGQRGVTAQSSCTQPANTWRGAYSVNPVFPAGRENGEASIPTCADRTARSATAAPGSRSRRR